MNRPFDKYAQTYQEVVQKSVSFSGLGYDFFLKTKAVLLKEITSEHFGEFARPSLLDVGCGIGRLHSLLGDRFGPISGVDESVESIETARRENPSVEYRLNCGSDLPFGLESFDIVTAVNVVHHVPSTMWGNFVLELKRVTRRGGLVCLIEHNPFNPMTRLSVVRCPFDREATLLSARTARRLLTQAGLAHVRSEHFVLFPVCSSVTRTFERWLGALPIGAQYIAAAERC
jgi:2-polyprenyl-3-methyl-5-hydroxy-6-metoxy-1,4-benzoquinol methylase